MITDNQIKMYERAEEIQKEWKKKRYDYAYCAETKLVKLCCDISYWETRIDLIYLPTQEQLQEMIRENVFEKEIKKHPKYYINIGIDSYICLTFQFHIWLSIKGGYRYIHNGFTLNEFWLAFVMHEKYHKIWTGEKWEEEKPK